MTDPYDPTVTSSGGSADPIASNLLPMTAQVAASGRLEVGGVDLVDLAEQVGTPLFVYDEAHLRASCREAVEAWGDGVAYATKAFLCMAMARLAHEEGMCLDVSTGGELARGPVGRCPCVPAGAPREQQVRRGAGLGTGLGGRSDRGRLLRRDRPHRASASAGRAATDRSGPVPRSWPGSRPAWRSTPTSSSARARRTPSSGSGWRRVRPPVAVDRLSKLAAEGTLELVGIHAHLGSQVFALAPFARAIEVLAEFFAPLGLPELVVGGGLGVPYVNGEEAPPMAQWAASVRRACREAGIPDSVRVTAEPGRSIVAACGHHPLPGGHDQGLPGHRTYVSVDGGMSDNPRPVLYGSGYEAFLPREPVAARPTPVRVVGKHCETGDVVVSEGARPRRLAVGDILATPVTGAYGYSMASNYNKVPRPPVVFVADGESRVVVRRETIDDLIRLDV